MTRPAPANPWSSVRPGAAFGCLVLGAVVGAVMLVQSGDDDIGPLRTVGALLFVLSGWIISLSLHEFAHAFTAFRFGDHTAETRGYLTLNPVKYAHPGLSIGLPLVIILLGGIGFPGGAVYLNESGFSKRQRTLVSVAGPATNFVLGIVLLLVAPLVGDDWLNLKAAVVMLGFLQITAAFLNILPVPGFDGYGAIQPYLSRETQASMAKIAPYGFLIVFALLFIPKLNYAFFDVVLGFMNWFDVPRDLLWYGMQMTIPWR
ncbi:site-2 protease family protein [Gordonia sp. X0973]|uniref:site-2 protease family protein n=1 Tax=Gordonia sp. X0973 TaxID=2742602 RepID=UPI000F54678E|nr:site-2 protease family protein [Gordonia sp. X0973]QKT08307.1 site-2 protease family protein [Gordonia sp. X0973]